MTRQQTDWMAHVKPGDVLETPSGDLRIARSVTRFPDGDLKAINFAIRRCSWTGRAYTCYGFTDLMKWKFKMKRKLPRDRISRLLAHDLRYECRMPEDQVLTCCSVVGVP